MNTKINGRPRLAQEERRIFHINIALNKTELAHIQKIATKANVRPAVWARLTAIGRLPPIIPEVNRQTYKELAYLAQNINQLTRYAHQGYTDLSFGVLQEILVLLRTLQRELIRASDDS